MASFKDLSPHGIALGQMNHTVNHRREHVSKSRTYSRSIVQPFPTDTQRELQHLCRHGLAV
jgi:hypothetical protein